MLTELKDLRLEGNIAAILLANDYSSTSITNVNEFISVDGSYEFFSNPVVDDADFMSLLGENYSELYFVKGSYYTPGVNKGQMAVIATYENKTAAETMLANFQSAMLVDGSGASLLQSNYYEYTKSEEEPVKYNVIFAVEVIMESSGEGGEGGEDTTVTPVFSLSFDRLCENATEYLTGEGYTRSERMESMGDNSFYEFSESDFASENMQGYVPGCSQLIMINGFENDNEAMGIFGQCDTKENMETTISNLMEGETEFPVYMTNEANQFYIAKTTGSSSNLLPLVNLSISAMAEVNSITNILDGCGYKAFAGTVAEFINNERLYEYRVITQEEMNDNDLVAVFGEKSTQVVIACESWSGSTGQVAYIGLYSKKEYTQSAYNNFNILVGDSNNISIARQEMNDNVAILVLTQAPESSTVTPLSDLSLESASKFDSINDYLTSCGYNEYTGTVDEYFSKSPDAYSFIKMQGSEFPGDDSTPAGLKEAPVVVVIAGIFNKYEQSTGFYAECNDEEAANDTLNELNNMELPEGGELVKNEISGNKLLWGMYAKVSQSVSRRSIQLKDIISTSGSHTIEIAPYNQYGEGPKSKTSVTIQGYSYTVDSNLVNISRTDGLGFTEILSCGINLHLSVTDDSKMLPETITVNNVNGYHYMRQSDNNRFGWLTIYEASGPVEIIFGELPDYSSSVKGNFTLWHNSDPEFKEVYDYEVDNWDAFIKENEIFTTSDSNVQYIYNGTPLYIGKQQKADSGQLYYTKVNIKNNVISEGKVYWVIDDESLFEVPSLDKEINFYLRKTNDEDFETTVTSNTESWEEFVAERTDFNIIDGFVCYNDDGINMKLGIHNSEQTYSVVKSSDIISSQTYFIVHDESLFTVVFNLIKDGEIVNTFNTAVNKQWGVFVSENTGSGFGVSGGVNYTYNGEQYKVTNVAGIQVQSADYIESGSYFLSK